MIKKLWCWLMGHKLEVYAYCRHGIITIHRKDTGTMCHELCRCTVCGYADGDGTEGLSWTGDLHYVEDKDETK